MGREGLAASGVLDAGALIAFERGDQETRAIIRRIRDRGGILIVPAPVLAQVWRGGARQARLAILVRAEDTLVEALDGEAARAVGVLLGRSGTADVVDASVVLSAWRHKAPVLTSDPDDLRRIDPQLAIEAV